MPGIDRVFFAEWSARSPRATRSVRRAGELLDSLAVDLPHRGILTVVGSKGKGTTAVYASAYLAATGRRVVTVTSPSFLRTNERIRVDGAAISDRHLAGLAERIDTAIGRLPPRAAADGYLSPGGLFTIAALLHAADVHADLVVLEAGRGGSSDEVSLVDAAVVAVAPVFEEHLAELGGSLASIVADKCGVVTGTTAAVLTTGRQPDTTIGLIRAAVERRAGGRALLEVDPAQPAKGPLGEMPERLLPAGLGRANALLGCRAAQQLLEAAGLALPAATDLERTLASMRLPGRLSHHPVGAPRNGSTAEIIIDAAVSRAGFAAALSHAARRWGRVDHVLISLPDDKDIDGAVAELDGTPTTFVNLDVSHLTYTRQLPPGWGRVDCSVVDPAFIAGLGDRVLAMGTISFVARMLKTVGADPTIAFQAPEGRD
jgi:dihydrofolate synthase / folylpolyglutamate synthase